MRSNLLATAILASFGLAGVMSATSAEAATKTSSQTSQKTAKQLAQMQDQMYQLQTQINALKAEAEQQADAQNGINVVQATAIEEAQASDRKTEKTVDALNKLVNNTTIGGEMFFDLTNIDGDEGSTGESGYGFDVKRFYLTVDHQFDDIWSANLTTDFTYKAGEGNTEVYVKKAYVQGKFNDAFVLRVGSADMAWIPYVEKFYGMRYVENTLVDRVGAGTSADWGAHVGGDFANGVANYQVSIVNGGGYANPARSKHVDVEARLAFLPTANTVIALGGYSGTLGQEHQHEDLRSAERYNVLAAYATPSGYRLGAEWFQTKNWSVTAPVVVGRKDRTDGWSVWGSVPLSKNGINAFARYDMSHPDKSNNSDLDNRYFNVGVEFPIIKGIKLATVYKDNRLGDGDSIEVRTHEFGVWGSVSF